MPDIDFKSLKRKSESELQKLGLRRWNNPLDPDETQDVFKKNTLWLFPVTWFSLIPEGFQVTTVFGKNHIFRRDKKDHDQREGLLSYGILIPLKTRK